MFNFRFNDIFFKQEWHDEKSFPDCLCLMAKFLFYTQASMTPFQSHVRLVEDMGSFLPINFDARSWSEVQDSKLSRRHGASLACNMTYFGHHVILTIVGTGWDDAPPQGGPKYVKVFQNHGNRVFPIVPFKIFPKWCDSRNFTELSPCRKSIESSIISTIRYFINVRLYHMPVSFIRNVLCR